MEVDVRVEFVSNVAVEDQAVHLTRLDHLHHTVCNRLKLLHLILMGDGSPVGNVQKPEFLILLHNLTPTLCGSLILIFLFYGKNLTVRWRSQRLYCMSVSQWICWQREQRWMQVVQSWWVCSQSFILLETALMGQWMMAWLLMRSSICGHGCLVLKRRPSRYLLVGSNTLRPQLSRTPKGAHSCWEVPRAVAMRKRKRWYPSIIICLINQQSMYGEQDRHHILQIRSFKVLLPSTPLLPPTIILTLHATSSPKFSLRLAMAPLAFRSDLVMGWESCRMALINIRRVKSSSTLLVRSSRPFATSLTTPSFSAVRPCLVRFQSRTARMRMTCALQGDCLSVVVSKERSASTMFLVKGSLMASLLRASSAMSERRKMIWPWSYRLSSRMALKLRQQHFISRQCSSLLPKSECSACSEMAQLRGRSICSNYWSLACSMVDARESKVKMVFCVGKRGSWVSC